MRNLKRGFTLAEVMIVLTVIGVLTAILLPVARQSMPDKDLMKFKKAHNTLGTVIRELVTSDKYYLDGDLGVRADGQVLHTADENYHKYFIASFADVLSVSYLSVKAGELNGSGWFRLNDKNCAATGSSYGVILDNCSGVSVPPERIEKVKQGLINVCNTSPSNEAKQIVLNNGVWYWDPFPYSTFGTTEMNDGTGRRLFHLKDDNGFYTAYKVFCMDIDGVPENATADDCINECPFVYGIRVDGQILTSQKVDEWLERDVNEE